MSTRTPMSAAISSAPRTSRRGVNWSGRPPAVWVPTRRWLHRQARPPGRAAGRRPARRPGGRPAGRTGILGARGRRAAHLPLRRPGRRRARGVPRRRPGPGPGPGRVPRPRDGRGLRGPRVASPSTTSSWPGRSGSSPSGSSCSRAGWRRLGRGAPGHRRRALAGRRRDDPHGAADRAGGVRALRPDARCRGCCWARSSPRTDGAAIFAVLRGSTLRRRLARTLEGEAGVNDPVAVILVIGFIDWIQDPHYGVADMALLFVEELGGRRWSSGSPSAGRGDVGAAPGPAGLRRPVPAGLARGRGAGLRRRGRGARLRVPRRLPLRHGPGQLRHPGAADDRDLPRRAWRGSRSSACSSRSACSCSRSRLGDVAVEGTVLALVAAAVARPLAVLVALPFGGYSVPDRLVLGWAGLRGAVPVVLATFPVIAGVDRRGRRVRHRLLRRRASSTVVQGATFEPFAHLLGRHERRAGAPGTAGGLRRRAPAGRRGAPVRGAPGRRGGRAPGARPGAAARRAAEPHRPRRTRRSRRAGRPSSSPGTTCTCWSARRPRSSSPGSCGAGARARWRGRPRRPIGRRGVTVFATGPWTPGDGDPAAPQSGRRPGGHRAPADPARRPGRARRPGGRPLRLHRAGQGHGLPPPAPGRRAAPAGPRPGDAERSWWREVIGALEGERPV